MANRNDLVDWLLDALKAEGGSGRIVPLCKRIWSDHEHELRTSGDLFYTWHYDVRWAATKLRKKGEMKAAENSPTGVWELA